jgi:hypothetical protein
MIIRDNNANRPFPRRGRAVHCRLLFRISDTYPRTTRRHDGLTIESGICYRFYGNLAGLWPWQTALIRQVRVSRSHASLKMPESRRLYLESSPGSGGILPRTDGTRDLVTSLKNLGLLRKAAHRRKPYLLATRRGIRRLPALPVLQSCASAIPRHLESANIRAVPVYMRLHSSRCPRCESQESHPSTMTAFFDVVMWVFLLEPRRCRRCFKRYYSFRLKIGR